MKIKNLLTALVILGASVAAPVASANDNVLQSIAARLLSSAVKVTVTELQQQATESVVNAAHHVSINPVEVATTVNVIELSVEQTKSKTTSKSE